MNLAIESLYATGHWLLEQERWGDAASVFRAMALAAPEDERCWLGLGASHEGVGQLAFAARLYDVGASVAREPVRCLVSRGRALRTLGDEDAADLAFDRASELAEIGTNGDLPAIVRAERRAS